MATTDAGFAGSIPATYDRNLGPLLFRPYAAEMARRARALSPRRILETAAGTGLLTEELRRVVPEAAIVATDLNQAMLDLAAGRIDGAEFRQADALDLPFEDGGFDLVVCQFGVMFYPDKVRGNREARRVLSDRGHYMVAIWDRLERNPVPRAVQEAIDRLFPDDPPQFLRRTPYGYADPAQIEADLEAAGFGEIRVETVEARSQQVSARDAAAGLCQGTPLRTEIENRCPERMEEISDTLAAELARFEQDGRINAPMSAHIVTAVR